MMRRKNYFISLLFLLAALTASAQTCPGPATRTALINLQKSQIVNGTRWGQTVLTDTCGNQRYVTLDSIIVIVTDSIAADTALQRNWYTHDGTTTNPLRTATILESARWMGDNPDGFIYFEMGSISGGRALIDTAASIFQSGLGGLNIVQADAQGIDIATSSSASRAVNVYTDTVNTRGSFDDTNFRLNLLSDNSYLYADSLKVVALGQFSDFPVLNFDGTEKGFFYDPSQTLGEGQVILLGGDGISGSVALISISQSSAGYSSNNNDGEITNGYFQSNTGQAIYAQSVLSDDADAGGQIDFSIVSSATEHIMGAYFDDLDTNRFVIWYIGESTTSPLYKGRRAVGWRTQLEDNTEEFDWIQSYLPNDTTGNQLSFYNRAYYWKNEHPIGVAGDTLFHFWAATGPGGEAGKDPGFVTLDDIRGGADNWYNSNGITTDNTRIADVLETATWRSDNGELDGLFPFRFELTDAGIANEPEMMVWKFPPPLNDSLTLAQSDQELFFRSTSQLLLWADDFLIGLGDSVRLGHAETASGGDIMAVAGADGSPGNVRTVKSLEGTFNADVLSWSAGAAGDRWDAVPANRSAILVTPGTGTSVPALSVENVLVDGAGGGTISLDYTPSMPSGSYTTKRYIYNEGGDASVTVDTDQAWQFRDTTGDLGTSFSLAAGANAELIWIYNATAADARFFVILF